MSSARWSRLPDHIDESRVHDQTKSDPDSSPEQSGEGVQAGKSSSLEPARGQKAEPDFRSKTEGRWWGRLQKASSLVWKAYEPQSFRIGPERHYRPDFIVQREGGALECHEIKGGYVRDRALVKPSAAAALYPMYDWAVLQQPGKTKPWSLKWLKPPRPDRGQTVAEAVADEIAC